MDEIMILPIITERDGVPVTTSRALADHFGKRHDNVLRDIENTIDQLNQTEEGKAFNALNFEAVNYLDAKGESRPMYLLTRDAFTLLAMGFTGSRALAFKVAYINAFNRMEQLLTGHAEAQAIPAPTVETLPTFSDRFLDAIRAALDSGQYTLRRKYGRNPEAGSGQIVGVYDDIHAAIGVLFACEVWAQASGQQLTPSRLRLLLASDGTIDPDDEPRRVQRINNRDVSTIHIPISLLKRPL
jgi:Rha family phage regulatory protein